MNTSGIKLAAAIGALLAAAQVAFALPNLTPYQPSGWSDKIVVSKVTGTTTDMHLECSPLKPDFVFRGF